MSHIFRSRTFNQEQRRSRSLIEGKADAARPRRRGDRVKRREFITLLGAAAAWPITVRAQHGAIPIVGYLSGASSDSLTAYPAVFRRSLAEAGYVEGQNVEIEYRWAGDQPDRLPALATELVSRKVTVLYAVSNAAAYAAKAATSTIPIVFLTGGDPAEIGLVASLNRPEGNATGVTLFLNELAAKRLELLREALPSVGVIAFMVNPTNPRAKVNTSEIQAAAQAGRQNILIVNVSHESEFDAAFAKLTQRGAGALLVVGDSLFSSQRDRLV